MAKFHVSDQGINICKATQGRCPYGAEAHFEDFEAASNYFVEKYDLSVLSPILKKDTSIVVIPDPESEEKQEEEMPEWERDLLTGTDSGKERLLNKYPHIKDPYVIDPAYSKVILPPETADQGGYMGGSRFIGGKRKAAANSYDYLGQSQIAGLIREDIAKARKLKEIPDELKITVRKNSGAWVNSLTIVVGLKDSSGKMTSVPDSWLYRDADEDRAFYSQSDPEFGDEDKKALYYGRGFNGKKVYTDKALQVKRYLEALGRQWEASEHNGMVDYHNSSGGISVDWKTQWN